MTTILTLALDARSQDWFETMRQRHYPPQLNRIGAHLTLFHKLPATDAVRETLAAECVRIAPFTMEVTGLRSLGRGVAYRLESAPLRALHRRLVANFAEELSPQDRQKFDPHIVVQNKTTGDEARALLAQLNAGFSSFPVQATGLEWWDYLGGPWQLRETLPFR